MAAITQLVQLNPIYKLLICAVTPHSEVYAPNPPPKSVLVTFRYR